jgi:hypothetical protein
MSASDSSQQEDLTALVMSRRTIGPLGALDFSLSFPFRFGMGDLFGGIFAAG